MPAPVGSPSHAQPITLQIFAGAKAARPAATENNLTWAETVEILSGELTARDPEKEKRDCLAFGTYRLRIASDQRAAGRSDQAVQAHTALTIDVDGCEIDPILDRVGALGWSVLIYGSASDPGPERPTARRVRIIAPIDREILGSEIKAARHRFAEALGIHPGQGVERADASAQIFFIGRALADKGSEIPNGDRARDWWSTIDGAPVEVDALLATPLREKWATVPASGDKARVSADGGTVAIVPTGSGRAATLLASLAPHWQAPGVPVEGGRRQLLRALGGYLARWGWSDDELRTVAAGLPTARPESERVELILEAASQRRGAGQASGVTAGWATLCGWDPKAAKVIEAAAGSSFAPKGAALTLARSVPSAGGAGPIILPELAALDEGRDGPRPSRVNVERILRWLYGDTLRFEECSGRIVVDPATPDPTAPGTTKAIMDRLASEWPDLASAIGSPWQDHHTSALAALCETIGLHVDTGRVWETVGRYAHARSYNAITEWALACAEGWDGTPRIDHALERYFMVGAGPDAGRVRDLISRIWLLSLAARAVEPGCQCDTALVLHGKEGLGKTSAVYALAGRTWGASGRLALDDAQAAHALRGKLIWEIGEGLGARTWEATKQFLSQRVDTYRAPYERAFSDVPRQVCFIVTINDDRFISDPRGARRFLPVTVEAPIDIAGIERDRAQLIGEAVTRILQGEQWHPTAEETILLEAARGGYTVESDPWCDVVEAWIAGVGAKHVRSSEVEPGVYEWRVAATDLLHAVHGALPMHAAAIDRKTYLRLAESMRSIGWGRVHTHDGWRYVTRRDRALAK